MAGLMKSSSIRTIRCVRPCRAGHKNTVLSTPKRKAHKKFACVLSNIFFVLPEGEFINQTFMVMAIAKGLDGSIVNPLEK